MALHADEPAIDWQPYFGSQRTPCGAFDALRACLTSASLPLKAGDRLGRTVQILMRGALFGLLLLVTEPALAHTESGAINSGFLSGFTHPIFGWDHVVAMVAVGLWGAFLGVPAIWLLPVVFPLVMAFGGALGILGVPIPAVEAGIATSAVVLGLLIAFKAKPPLWIAGGIVGLFAIFHGHAHGTELPAAANPFAFATGFVIATGLLHLIGIGFGTLARWPAGTYAVRAGGGAIALAGLAFLFGIA